MSWKITAACSVAIVLIGLSLYSLGEILPRAHKWLATSLI
jgi:hypothetical protein